MEAAEARFEAQERERQIRERQIRERPSDMPTIAVCLSPSAVQRSLEQHLVHWDRHHGVVVAHPDIAGTHYVEGHSCEHDKGS